MGYCKLQIIGHLGQNARVNIVNGKQVVNISCCYTEKWKDAQGNTKEKSLWVDASYWSDSSTIVQYLIKGQQVMLEGVPDVRTYENNSRQVVAQITLRVTNLVLLGSANRDNNNNSSLVNKPVDKETDISQDDNEVPF